MLEVCDEEADEDFDIATIIEMRQDINTIKKTLVDVFSVCDEISEDGIYQSN